jgi:hypothetical protein
MVRFFAVTVIVGFGLSERIELVTCSVKVQRQVIVAAFSFYLFINL